MFLWNYFWCIFVRNGSSKYESSFWS